jgi:hypothetical protein
VAEQVVVVPAVVRATRVVVPAAKPAEYDSAGPAPSETRSGGSGPPAAAGPAVASGVGGRAAWLSGYARDRPASYHRGSICRPEPEGMPDVPDP